MRPVPSRRLRRRESIRILSQRMRPAHRTTHHHVRRAHAQSNVACLHFSPIPDRIVFHELLDIGVVVAHRSRFCVVVPVHMLESGRQLLGHRRICLNTSRGDCPLIIRFYLVDIRRQPVNHLLHTSKFLLGTMFVEIAALVGLRRPSSILYLVI